MKSDFVFLFLSLPTPTHGHLLQVTLLRQSTSLQPKTSQCSQVHKVDVWNIGWLKVEAICFLAESELHSFLTKTPASADSK